MEEKCILVELEKKGQFIDNQDDKREVVAYIRVSTKDQKNGYSLEGQRKTIDEYAYNQGDQITEYFEETKSAWQKGTKRIEYEKLLKKIKSNKVKTIYIWKSDRMARRSENSDILLENLIKFNVKLVSMTEGIIDHSCADGRKGWKQKGIDNEHSSDLTSERVYLCAKTSARSGNFPFAHVPLGFERKTKWASSPLIINEEQAKIIRKIYSRIVDDKWGVKKLLRELNDDNALNKKWYEKGLYNLIINPIYMGVLQMPLHHPRYKILNYIEKIVDSTIWENAQKTIHSRNYKKKYKYIFSGRVYCKTCNCKLVAMPTKKYNGTLFLYHFCKTCNKRINEKIIYEHLLPIINHQLLNINKNDAIKALQNDFNKIEADIQQLEAHYFEKLVDDNYYYTKLVTKLKNRKSCLEKLDAFKKELNIDFSSFSYIEKRTWLIDNSIHIIVDLANKTVILKFSTE